MIRELRKDGVLRFEELRTSNMPIIFANEVLAKETWRKASEVGGEAARKVG